MMKILVSDPVLPLGLECLQGEFELDFKKGLTKEQLIEIIPNYDALIVRSETKATKEVIEAGKNLKAIGRAGVGVDNIDVDFATKQGVIVLNAPDGNTVAATEHTIAMMMSLARNVPQAFNSMREKKWERSKFVGVEVRGKTLGILGLGRIGTGVAKRAIAMEMKVLGYDPFVTEEQAEANGIGLVDLETIFKEADFITLHLPKNADTKYLLNKEAFSKMKKGVRIINCARGGVVDEKALLEALNEGIVSGAAIDVFEKEPVDFDNPLLNSEKIIYTPHLGASTEEAQINVAVDVAKGVAAVLHGEPVSNAVNMSPVPSHVLEFVRPYLTLAEKMGCLAVHQADGRIGEVFLEYNGRLAETETKIITSAVLIGILRPILQETINYVNVMNIVKSRGIKVRELKTEETDNFANSIKVRVKTEKKEHCVLGTLFGKQEPRIVLVDNYRVDIDPKGWLLLCPHMDRPGMIGMMGTLMGEHGINIASMQVGRASEEGKSMMAMSVEADIPTPLMLKIKALEGILGAKLINFEI